MYNHYSKQKALRPNPTNGKMWFSAKRQNHHQSSYGDVSEYEHPDGNVPNARVNGMFMSSKSSKCKNHVLKYDNLTLFKASTTKYNIMILGLCSVLGGHAVHWNIGLSAGFGSFIVCFVLVAIAYIIQVFTVAELSSAFPFSGGSFGFSRCTLGYFPGFLVAVLELSQAVLFLSIFTLTMGEASGMLIHTTKLRKEGVDFATSIRRPYLKPLIWLVFLYLLAVFKFFAGKVFWKSANVIVAIAVLIALVYCCGSLAFVDFSDNAVIQVGVSEELRTNSEYFVGGWSSGFAILPLPCWFFTGLQSVITSSDEIDQPKSSIPSGLTGSLLCSLLLSVCVILVFSSLPPDVYQLLPYSRGYAFIFDSSPKLLPLISFPAIFASGYGYLFMSTKLVHALACSKLFPRQFKRRHGETGSPHIAIFWISVLSLAVCSLAYTLSPIDISSAPFSAAISLTTIPVMFNVAMLCNFVVYIAQGVNYVFLVRQFENLPRSFSNPAGIGGVVVACVIWTAGLISICTSQHDSQMALIVFVIMIAVWSVIYSLFLRSVQVISRQEGRVLFKAHVVIFNKNKNKKKGKFSVLSSKVSLYLSYPLGCLMRWLRPDRPVQFESPRLSFASIVKRRVFPMTSYNASNNFPMSFDLIPAHSLADRASESRRQSSDLVGDADLEIGSLSDDHVDQESGACGVSNPNTRERRGRGGGGCDVGQDLSFKQPQTLDLSRLHDLPPSDSLDTASSEPVIMLEAASSSSAVNWIKVRSDLYTPDLPPLDAESCVLPYTSKDSEGFDF